MAESTQKPLCRFPRQRCPDSTAHDPHLPEKIATNWVAHQSQQKLKSLSPLLTSRDYLDSTFRIWITMLARRRSPHGNISQANIPEYMEHYGMSWFKLILSAFSHING
jgi:hypothetical protein